MFFSLEQFAIFLGVVNAIILLLKPAARVHSRIDHLEFKMTQNRDRLDALERTVYDREA